MVGGRVYGYKNERLPGVKGAARLVINQEQAQVVRRIFRMAADGLGHSGIARQLNAEGYERDLRDQQERVERLRRVWGGWAAALDADVPTARQILKKVLVGRIYVRPAGPGAWRFAGISRYDGALRGGLGRTAPADVLPGYGPRNDDFCRLMLHLLVAPNGTAETRTRAGGSY